MGEGAGLSPVEGGSGWPNTFVRCALLVETLTRRKAQESNSRQGGRQVLTYQLDQSVDY